MTVNGIFYSFKSLYSTFFSNFFLIIITYA